MYFDPNCKFSQQQTETIIRNIKLLKNVHFYFFTNKSFITMNEFKEYYKLGNYKNITVGRDYTNYFSKEFSAYSYPWLVIYNKQQKLKKVIIGGTDIETIKNLTSANPS
ncbi:hypothetical protein A4D02_32855 [Niastella koreensis]|nr:hypothetical protein A4D02_32855 [Niastella koreensis]